LESASESQPVLPPEPPREPILTLPGALTAYVALLAAIHLRVLLPPDLENWTIDVFAFIPKRYDSTLLDITFPGGAGAKVWTFVTYSLLHANLSHIGFNVLWLLPFGSALARRFGAARFFLFMAVTAVAGALAHLLTHEHAIAPMIGASASVSGTMAAAIRFAFVQGSFLSFRPWRRRRRGERAGAVAVARVAQRTCAGFSASGSASTSSSGLDRLRSAPTVPTIAWQAHIGGFLAGLMLFSLSIRCHPPHLMLQMRHRRTDRGKFDCQSLIVKLLRLIAACGARRFHPSSSPVLTKTKPAAVHDGRAC